MSFSIMVSMEDESDDNFDKQLAKLNDSVEFIGKNRSILNHIVRLQLKKEIRKLKSSITDSIMEELVNNYGKKLEMTDTLKLNFDQMSQKLSTFGQSLTTLGHNYKILSRNHRNLVDLVRNNIISNKQEQIKSNNLKKKSIETKPKDKLKLEFISDLENKYSVLFDGGILGVLRSLNEPTTIEVKTTTSSNFLIVENIPTDCQDLAKSQNQNGIYKITILKHNVSFDVLCEFEGDIGWTVLQDRHDGSVSFNQNWLLYKEGFGNLEKLGEFWLGLEKMYYLTNQYNYSLQIIMSDWKNEVYVAEYTKFKIDNEKNKFKLELGAYLKNVSSVGDSFGDGVMGGHNNMAFSTYDSDNDMRFYDNCAQIFKSGWWFNACFQSNLNGIYYTYSENGTKTEVSKHTRSNKLVKKDEHSQLRFLRNGIHWNSIDLNLSLKTTKLRIKRNNF
ncbi:unnamed protein product [Brachionus calyciflorus]|uniref:Fibrinogen C-terminal domain-containing protein n=1 Tax=Brachionus calyciflorus TaxID=104777 RepID=A0A813VC74_9BILA|nr:unnamed protein product [Brachionus calyciflorus]